MALPDASWFPPTSLTGRHWRLEILHVSGAWRWYTEHLTEYDAQRQLRYREEYDRLNKYRIVEAFR